MKLLYLLILMNKNCLDGLKIKKKKKHLEFLGPLAREKRGPQENWCGNDAQPQCLPETHEDLPGIVPLFKFIQLPPSGAPSLGLITCRGDRLAPALLATPV